MKKDRLLQCLRDSIPLGPHPSPWGELVPVRLDVVYAAISALHASTDAEEGPRLSIFVFGSNLAGREAIIRADFSLLLWRANDLDEARRQAMRSMECWAESRAEASDPSEKELRYVKAMRDAGLLAGP